MRKIAEDWILQEHRTNVVDGVTLNTWLRVAHRTDAGGCKDRCWETNQKVIITLLKRNDDGLDQGGEKQLYFLCIIFQQQFLNDRKPSSGQSLSHVRLFATLWTTALQASLSITTYRSLLKLMSIELVMPSNHLILCHPFLLLPSIFPSIRVFSNESVLHIRGPKYWSFSFSISPSNEHPGLISFRMDQLDLLAVQGTLKSLLQHHSSKASILRLSAFFIVQLSHPYVTTGKTIALTRWTFVSKVMSLLFNVLSLSQLFFQGASIF